MDNLDTRQKLIDQALHFFTEHDYERSSLNDIAKALGVTKGAIYHYFKGKEDLFLSAVERLLNLMALYMEQGAAVPGISCHEYLKDLLNIPKMVQAMEEMAGIGALLMDFEKTMYMIMAGVKKFPQLKEKLNQVYSNIVKDMVLMLNRAAQKGEVRQNLDFEAVAFEIIAFYEGAFLMGTLCDNSHFFDLTSRVFLQIWDRISIKEESLQGIV